MSQEKVPPQHGDWARIAHTAEFKNLLASKRRFIIPATIFFIVYYFTLPVLVGYAPALMARKVVGPINIAYLFALSQFFVAWIIAGLYVRAAGRHDQMIREILDRAAATRETEPEPQQSDGAEGAEGAERAGGR
jgi:uncharacterized membrane protein (DUF485 family)